MQENMFTECLILNGKKSTKNNQGRFFNYLICYTITLVYLIKLLLKILEFFVFFIIGRNKPKMYNKIITRDTINIALTAFIFIKIIFLSIEETVQQNYKVYG